ncbi:uncharacterized protein LOC109713145 isoform X1 [Ananas comosus]|uniref:Uncharacterized protein LOC109713145 isoform X1 n=1 Tax=Ananas comosus TaxID=4615 RepID=A0A6P5FAS6_ANACO|nr:uncharacterized protein LOC109713145 isoform X1 [Ananas comosus]
MASSKPSSRYASVDSHSSTSSSRHSSNPSPSFSDHKIPSKNLSSLRRLLGNASRRPSDPVPVAAAMENPCRAVTRARSGNAVALTKAGSGHNLGSVVKKMMERRPDSKAGSAALLVVPADLIAEDTKKTAKGSNLSALSRKLFQKGGSGDRAATKALAEAKANTRTLAQVLRSERELLSQNKEYEAEMSELRLLLEERNREVEKLKDLCLKQREEIKALKDAVLFPDVMNSQLQELLQRQGSELKHAKQVIPNLQRQVSSLTGQIQCLVEDLAEVKSDKYSARACFDGQYSFPRSPIIFDQETANPLPLQDYSSSDPVSSEYGSPDEMFLKDLNPCLTPCFSKNKSKECDEASGCISPNEDRLFCKNTGVGQGIFPKSRGCLKSKSSEHCQKPNSGSSSAQKICKSDENKWSVGKSTYQSLF